MSSATNKHVLAYRRGGTMDTARLVRKIRRRTGLTQEKFGRVVGVTWLTIHRWEKGKFKPHPVFLEKLKEIDKRV